MTADKDDPRPPKRPANRTEREARLAKALRDNLRRRKAAPADRPAPGDEGD